MRKISLAAMFLASVVGSAAAQAQVEGQIVEGPKQAESQAQPPARYAFNPVKEGFLRLDNVSGQVSFCSPTSAGWACQAVPEDRAALEKEIARLQDEVTSLKQQVATLRDPPPPRPPADLTPRSEQSDKAAELRADLARAKAAVQDAWQRVVDMIKGFQKDVMRKG